MTTDDVITYVGSGVASVLSLANIENIISIIALIISILTTLSNLLVNFIFYYMLSSSNKELIFILRAFDILYKVNIEKFFEHFGASIRLIYAYEYPVIFANSF